MVSHDVSLELLIKPASTERAGRRDFPVLSMTMHKGLVDQATKFKKRVASADTSDYKVVRRNQLVVGFPIDEGVLSIQDLYDEAIVSPAYDVWDLRSNYELEPSYLERFLRSPRALAFYRAKLRGTTARRRTIPDDVFLKLPVPLPQLSEQRRVTQMLDKAETLLAKRRASLVHFESLTQSTFLAMFGDPATNPLGWPREPIGSLAIKFSDGPFGSNLKSEHYTNGGVRVIRLQNIGVGEFLDDDKAYISEDHFASLRKHECLPGDVIIGTLGDPNLRACVQPDWLPRALNKADCVQLRPDEAAANAAYLCALLNCPSTERMARGLALGQTRLRISMGRLRGLVVPIPPIHLQHAFASRLADIRSAKATLERSLSQLDRLFASLQQRAFRTEL